MAIQTSSLRRAGSMLTLLGGVAALLLLAEPARAQDICGGDLEGLVEDVLDLYLEELDDEWGVEFENQEFCAKLANNFFKACQTLAKDTVKCIQNQVKAVTKQNQEGCKEFAGSEASACSNSYKNESKQAQENLSEAQGDLELQCGLAAEDYFFICMFGD